MVTTILIWIGIFFVLAFSFCLWYYRQYKDAKEELEYERERMVERSIKLLETNA